MFCYYEFHFQKKKRKGLKGKERD
jgi:hypothetical protein